MSASPSDAILRKFENIKDDIVKLASSETSLQVQIKQLEADLDVYKRIFGETNLEKQRLKELCEQLRNDLEKQRESFERQVQPCRVLVLLDGDGAIFTPQLVALGYSGGHKAASQLSELIKDHIHSLGDIRQFQLSVYIFFNKRGLTDTLGRCGHHAAKARFDEFIAGFNQATERFMMVDVGGDKEAADSKMRAYLEDEIQLPQTYKVVFGGCHDNGYVTTIRSHLTSGFKHKFILLKSYTENATGFNDLGLPVIESTPGLFISQKLAAFSPVQDPLTVARKQSPPLQNLPFPDAPLAASGRGDTSLSVPGSGAGNKGLEASPPTTYSRILLKQVDKRSTTDSDSSSDNNSEDLYFNQDSGTRRLKPKVALSKQKPPPCTLFYLADNCRHGAECRYAHDYILEAEHYTEMKANAKKSPCPAVNRNETCTWGDTCCYGHICPLVTKCHYLKLGRCRFIGADMHKEPKDAKN